MFARKFRTFRDEGFEAREARTAHQIAAGRLPGDMRDAITALELPFEDAYDFNSAVIVSAIDVSPKNQAERQQRIDSYRRDLILLTGTDIDAFLQKKRGIMRDVFGHNLMGLRELGVGGGEKGDHFGGDGGDWSPAFRLEPFPLDRRACSERPGVRQGRAVVGRGEANP